MQGAIARKEIEKTLQTNSFEVIQYPYSTLNLKEVDWTEQKDMITELAKQVIMLRDKEIYIFPLAHVPLLVVFGYELQKNSHYTIFQYDRFDESWVYTNCEEEKPNLKINYYDNGNSVLALCIAVSTQINISDIDDAMNMSGKYDLLLFDKDEPHIPGKPLHHKDVMRIVQTIFETLYPLVNKYTDIHIFASVSAGLAIEIGRIIQHSIFPTIHLYNYNRPYCYCFSINRK